MNVLVACECSGIVREAFRKRGHNAWSCDILPSEDNSPYHIRTDVVDLLQGLRHPDYAGDNDGRPSLWDLVIAHPPCDYLANSGVRWLTTIPVHPKKDVKYGEERRQAMIKGAAFFNLFKNAAPKVCIENPIMHKHARALVGRRPDQTVQPYEFGDPFRKRTGLWLNSLPKLIKTSTMQREDARDACWREPPGPHRKPNRSRFYQGIAEAMADQWGRL